MTSKQLPLIGLMMVLAACGSPEPAANDIAAAAEEPEAPAATAAGPANDAAADTLPQATSDEKQPAIPAALHGRWGLTPADCTAVGSNGRVTITGDEVRFYESVAKPEKVRSRSDTEIKGEFAFTGEGGNWSNPMSWTVAGDKLTRVDSEEDSRQVYTRC